MMRSYFGRCLASSTIILRPKTVKQVQIRWEGDGYKSEFGSSTILVQDGTGVSELPLVIRKVYDILSPDSDKVKPKPNEYHKTYTNNTDVFNLIHKEFAKCPTCHEVVTLLAKCSRITPNIAAGAIERFLILRERDPPHPDKQPDIDEGVLLNLISNLVETVMKSNNAYTIVNCMKTIPAHLDEFRNSLCGSLLEKIMDKNLSVLQLCDVVDAFSQTTKYHKHLENADKLWFGFVEMEPSIEKKEIVRCFEVLHHLKCSRRMVINVLERRIVKVWFKLDVKDVSGILSQINKYSLSCPHTLEHIGRWLSTSIHTLNDEALLGILNHLGDIGYTDSNIQKSLERFVKMKGINIELHMLVVAIMNHCMSFRIRNLPILKGCAEYIVAHGKSIDPIFIRPLFYPFAWLNFNPHNAYRFWEIFEETFQDKFHRMNKEDVLDVMVGCVFLQKYPLNFIEQVYNPSFLDKLSATHRRDYLKNKLKLLDTAMTIECKGYNGPLLPKDHNAKSLWQDARITRIINQMRENLEEVAGGPECMSTNVILPNVFATELYLVDVMLHPAGLKNSILNFNFKMDRNINTALLIHLPEYFCSNDDTLIGPQSMRIRHMKILGLKVVTVKYDILAKLRMHKTELRDYLVDRLKKAECAL